MLESLKSGLVNELAWEKQTVTFTRAIIGDYQFFLSFCYTAFINSLSYWHVSTLESTTESVLHYIFSLFYTL